MGDPTYFSGDEKMTGINVTSFRLLLCSMVVCCFGISVSNAQDYKTYNEAFTQESGRAYKEDINIWVYTSGFAERFAMPKQWIDDSLSGALAIAYRVEERAIRRLFAHKAPGVSVPIKDCMIDVYFSSKHDIPWFKYDNNFKVHQVPDSPGYLLGQNKEDWDWSTRWVREFHLGEYAGKYLVHIDGGTLTIREFDEKVFPGIAYVSFKMNCLAPPRRDVLIEFCRDKPWGGGKCDSHLSIKVPKSYMVRVYSSWLDKKGKRSKSEYESVLNRKRN